MAELASHDHVRHIFLSKKVGGLGGVGRVDEQVTEGTRMTPTAVIEASSISARNAVRVLALETQAQTGQNKIGHA
jgi:hypothetical protein